MRNYFLFLMAAFIFFPNLSVKAADGNFDAVKEETYDKYVNSGGESRAMMKREAYGKYIANSKDGRSIVASMAFVCVKKGEEYASAGNTSFPDEDIALNLADQCVVEAEKMLVSSYTAKMTKKNLAPIVNELMGNIMTREYIMLCAIGSLGAGITSYKRDHAFMSYEMRIATAAGIMDAAKEQWLE